MNALLQKIASIVSVSLFVLVGFSGTAQAQNELIFGQDHFYSVVFRGNGEAVTQAKLIFQNTEEKPLTEYSFEIPRAKPTEIAMYQMNIGAACINYDSKDITRPCIPAREPDYSSQYSYYGFSNGNITYQKIPYTKSGSVYRLSLPKPVAPNATAAIIVAYAAKGYVSDRAGLKAFNFETLKVPARIQGITVAVDVDSDLLLKGKKSSVDYNTIGTDARVPATLSEGVSSQSMDNTVGKIGAYGALTKTAKNLSPNESLNVRGEYASSWLRLYLSSIVLAIGVIVAIFAGLYFLARFLKRRRPETGKIEAAVGDQGPVNSSSHHSLNLLSISHALVSLISVVAVVVLTYGLKYATEANLFTSQNVDPIVSILMVITIILLYALVIIGPAIFIAIKHGWKAFLAVIVADLLWLVIFLVLYLLLFQAAQVPNGFQIEPVPAQFRGGPLE